MGRYEINSIAHIIDYLGLSQRTVAARTGVSQSMISRVANTHWNELEYDLVMKILSGIYDDTTEGQFKVEKTQDNKVASVIFVYSLT